MLTHHIFFLYRLETYIYLPVVFDWITAAVASSSERRKWIASSCCKWIGLSFTYFVCAHRISNVQLNLTIIKYRISNTNYTLLQCTHDNLKKEFTCTSTNLVLWHWLSPGEWYFALNAHKNKHYSLHIHIHTTLRYTFWHTAHDFLCWLFFSFLRRCFFLSVFNLVDIPYNLSYCTAIPSFYSSY